MDLPRDILCRQDGATQERSVIWRALTSPPPLSAAGRMSSSVPRGFGSFPAFTSSPRLLLPLLGLAASGAGTWSVPTQGAAPADGIGGETARTAPGAAV